MKTFLLLSFITFMSAFASDYYYCDYLEGIEEYYVEVMINSNDVNDSTASFRVHQSSGRIALKEKHGNSYIFASYLGREFGKTQVNFNSVTKRVSVTTNIDRRNEIFRSAKYGCEKR